MTFYEYVTTAHKGEDSPLGDLAGDVASDRDFPREENDYYFLLRYLHKTNACDGALEAFDEAYSLYVDTGEDEATIHKFNPFRRLVELINDEANDMSDYDSVSADEIEEMFWRLRKAVIDTESLDWAFKEYGDVRE